MDELRRETEILHLIYKKNRNQHRTQVWWKYFSILHRRLRQLTEKGRLDEDLCEYLVAKLIPTAYRHFQNILTQGAFITLGFALIASLAKIWDILCTLCPLKQRARVGKQKPDQHVNPDVNLADSGTIEDIGDIVEDIEHAPLATGDAELNVLEPASSGGETASVSVAAPASSESNRSESSEDKSKSKSNRGSFEEKSKSNRASSEDKLKVHKKTKRKKKAKAQDEIDAIFG